MMRIDFLPVCTGRSTRHARSHLAQSGRAGTKHAHEPARELSGPSGYLPCR
jgi:hypothetical protein